MIDFRYHLVSIVAIFLALATGVALGAGPLNGPFSQGIASQADRNGDAEDELRRQVADNRRVSGFQDDYAKTVAPMLLSSRLKDQTIAVFTLPGSEPDDVKGVVSDIKAAGGTVTTRVGLTGKLLDPSGRQFAQGVAEQSIDGVAGVPSTANQSNYELVGSALGRAFLSEGDADERFDEGSATITSAFKEADLLTIAGANPTRRARLAVFVAGASGDDAKDGQGELVRTLASAADVVSDGVVVGGPASAARGSGVIKALRDGDAADTVSSVDVVDTPAGQIVTVLALQREAAGDSGHYGAVDPKDGAMPDLDG